MHMITTTAALKDACTALAQCDFITVDTEFLRESTYYATLCLIQAAGTPTPVVPTVEGPQGGPEEGRDASAAQDPAVEILIDPLAKDIDLAPFWALMADTSVLKVFHAARQDLEIFYTLSGALPAPLFDSQVAAAALGLGDSVAYDGLVRQLLNRNVDKSSRFTDWSKRPLTDKQRAYALADVTHLRDLYPIMAARLEERGRTHWLAEDMALLCDPETYAVRPEDAWKRLKLRKRTPQFLAALKAAAAWREREAQTRNQPRSWVMKDDVVYEVAMQGAKTPEAIGNIRSAPKGFERSRAAKTLAKAVHEALRDPEANAPKIAPPTGPRPTNAGSITELLKVLLRARAEEHEVAARLIATTADLEAIAARDDAPVPALTGWRAEVFGNDALALKRGELALFMDGDKVSAVRR